MKKIISLILVLVMVVSLSGCTEKGELAIKYGETAEIVLSKEYEQLVWESGDTAIATIENGVVKGVGPGQTIVTATNNAKKIAQYTINVEIIEIAELFLQTDELEIKIGESADLTYSLFPINASDYGLTYTSINPEIATVDENGHIEAVGVGKTNIVLSTLSGKTVACEVIVNEPSAIEQLNDAEAELFQYLIEKIISYTYNAPALRIRNFYTTTRAQNPATSVTAILQGTNKLGGTIFKAYLFFKFDDNGDYGHFELPDTYDVNTDREIIPMPADILDYVKINAALDEYWENTNVSK